MDLTSGTALAETYGLEAGTAIQLSNISTRGFVGTGDAVMIAGIIVDGPPGSILTFTEPLETRHQRDQGSK